MLAVLLVSCAADEPQLHQPVGRTPIIERFHPEDEAEPNGGALTHPATVDAAAKGPAERDAGRPPVTLRGAVHPLCDLPSDAEDALHFSTNSFALHERGEQLLNQVATCMLYGSLEGERIVVYGHADPRGTEPYNAWLANQRATTVQRYLIRRGVEPTRISVASQGERKARGVGPESWFYDRRVEIEVAEE